MSRINVSGVFKAVTYIYDQDTFIIEVFMKVRDR